jgi:hypothetical protein
MNDTDFLALLMRHQDGTLTPDEMAALEDAMRGDATRRRLFAEAQLRSMALHEHFRRAAFQQPLAAHPQPRQQQRTRWFARPVAALAAGLAIGLFSASLLWAISAPRVTSERLFALANGGFEEGRAGRGFPRQTGLWSGDEATIREGRLHFIATGSDHADPSARAISCDVFQLVDLRPLRQQPGTRGDSMLELSASFADTRPPNTQPSVTFFCQLYLFSGDPARMHQTWPVSIPDALASGSAQITTLGTDARGARTLTARCLLPAEADFAVAQIVARPNLRPAKLEGLFADDVKLTLKTAPELPVRMVQR